MACQTRDTGAQALAPHPPRQGIAPAGRRVIAGLVLALAAAGQALAADLSLAWDPVGDPRVAGYQVHFGPASQMYSSHLNTTGTSAVVSGLTPGQRYYLAVRACAADGVMCSGFSNEVSATPPYPPPVADFAVSVRSGVAPLTASFSDRSTGQISARTWTFGDGGTSTAATAVHTYTLPGTYTVSLQVSGAGGVDTEVKAGFIQVQAPAPVANFTGDVLRGPAPLTVRFHNASTGQITTSTWSFGDGSTLMGTQATHSYTTPGVYAVTLAVSGPGGANTLTRSAYVQVEAGPVPVPMDIGEVLVDHQWQWVAFSAPYTDPIVVAKPLSANDSAPADVRVKGVDEAGFWIRVQEWDYLDGIHPYETVSYMVMERGRHQMPDGAWVEAGRLTTKGYASTAFSALVAETFSEPFATVPVVFATVTSVNEGDAVTTRLRNITVTDFQVGMQEQESSRQQHLPETIDYIAWEPSFGVVNGLRYAVGLMSETVTSAVSTFVYPSAFARPPLFLADMQTTASAETATLRWRNRNQAAVEIWVSEEQSKDAEMVHVAESVGYFVADDAP